jgi:hypothetical protein
MATDGVVDQTVNITIEMIAESNQDNSNDHVTVYVGLFSRGSI